MNTLKNIARPESRIAWIIFLIVLAAFFLGIWTEPFVIRLGEGVLSLAIVILAFVVSFGSIRTGASATNSNGELDALLVSVPDPLIIYDKDFRVMFFNANAEALFNLPSKTVLGHVLSPRDVNTPEWKVLTQTIFPSLAPRVVARSKEGDRPQIFELSFTDPELELRVLTAAILDERGSPQAFLKLVHNVTPVAAALRSKSEFVTVASHQFRGPITDISWALQALTSDAGMSETSKQIVANALAASQGLIRRVEDLLSVAKLEEGQTGYSFEETDIVEFVGKVLADILPAAQKAGIKMYFDRPATALPHVTIDPRQISIVLVNLLENAIRYNIENGEVIVRVDPVEGKPFIRVSVKDTGIGIPKEAISQLFKKFFRADNAVQSQTEGSGLGLYIAKGIVNAHGGDMGAESELGRGTVMYFTLPTDPSLVPKHEGGNGGFLQ